MARKRKSSGRAGKTKEGSMSSYWKEVLQRQPHLLNERSNKPFFDQWIEDNPGHEEVPEKVKNSLNSVKRQLRNAGKGKKKTKTSASSVSSNGAKPKATLSAAKLATLEEKIDDCLVAARNLGREELDKIIDTLRDARNAVVVMQHV